MILHAHLPFVRHPEHHRFHEEDWLFEAMTETYIPLIELCRRLLGEGVGFRLTLSISPTLAAMLGDPLLQARYRLHLEKLIALAAEEEIRTRWTAELHGLAVRYRRLFEHTRDRYERDFGGDLLAALRELADRGALELITTGATHGFLPLMLGNRNLWRGQILTAVGEHVRIFGRPPRGFWLPECGYEHGVDDVLREAGIEYVFADAHGVNHGHPRPRFGVYAPILTPRGVVVLGRDVESARQVWSSRVGYPGDPDYREFYRDVGWDLDYEYLQPYLHADGRRTSLGIKYHRITGPEQKKMPYNFERARRKAAQHAEHFHRQRVEQTLFLRSRMRRTPVIVAPYDAELFGHWWYEGPLWLEELLRRCHRSETVAAVEPGRCLEALGPYQVVEPAPSSWGLNGYAEHWLDPSNDWIYPLLHKAGERMVELANRFAGRPQERSMASMTDRAMRQAARELLLAQSSDWAFILKAGTVADYAAARTREHLESFDRLYGQLNAGAIDEHHLATLEEKDNLFPDLDWTVFADR